MQFGICGNADLFDLAVGLGYDYAEPPLASMAALSEGFAAFQARAQGAGSRLEVFNIFFPRMVPARCA